MPYMTPIRLWSVVIEPVSRSARSWLTPRRAGQRASSGVSLTAPRSARRGGREPRVVLGARDGARP